MTMQTDAGWGREAWRRNTAAGRWYGLGRWYAMFPAAFARDTILGLSRAGETVLDPFCGRGNAPFAASVLGRASMAIDIHPLAWLWTQTKLDPEPDLARLLRRLGEVARAARPRDRRARTRFEQMAWAPPVRAFLRAARRELDWRDSVTDRTLMAFTALHAQDKRGSGLSNQLSPTVAYSPAYAVRWWASKGLSAPPDVNPAALLADRIERRYALGVPQRTPGTAVLGDALDVLATRPPIEAGLLLTSPPYRGVTDYWNDHWIRLWLLGHDMRKDWRRISRYEGEQEYRDLVTTAFEESKRHLKPGGAVLVRCDQRRKTAHICIEALRAAWPGRRLFVRTTEAARDGVSTGHGRGGSKARELDLLIPGNRAARWRMSRGFRLLDQVI